MSTTKLPNKRRAPKDTDKPKPKSPVESILGNFPSGANPWRNRVRFSNGNTDGEQTTILNLVHPSLFCYVAGVSKITKTPLVLVSTSSDLARRKSKIPRGDLARGRMLNERIVSSGIYYYSSKNITESKLAFRAAIHELRYQQDDPGRE